MGGWDAWSVLWWPRAVWSRWNETLLMYPMAGAASCVPPKWLQLLGWGLRGGGGGMSMVAAGRGLVGSMKLGRSGTSPWSEPRRGAARWPPVPVRGLSCICSSTESSLCRHRSPHQQP